MPEIKKRAAWHEHNLISATKAFWSPEHEKIDAANFLALNMGYKYFRGLNN
jgi:hypothetical protein